MENTYQIVEALKIIGSALQFIGWCIIISALMRAVFNQ